MILVKKTGYTALATTLTTAVNFVSQLVLYPVFVVAFGSSLFGLYTIINKASSFLSIVDLRPSACLRYVIAQEQSNSENSQKKQSQYVSASVFVAGIMMPLIMAGGFLLGFAFPGVFKIPGQLVTTARICVLLVAVRLVAQGFAGVPQAAIRGNNLEYHLWWVNILQTVLNLGVIIVLLKLKFGLVAIVAVPLTITFCVGGIEFLIMRKKLPWIRWKKPRAAHVKAMFGYGIWYLMFSLAFQFYQNLDVLLLGYMANLEAVTVYTISKSLMFRCGEAIANIMNAPTASIGDILGRRDYEMAKKARDLTFSACFFAGIIMSTGFILLNSSFVGLWIGSGYYIGNSYNKLIVIAELLALMTTAENIVINSSLNFRNRFFCFIAAIGAQTAMTVVLWRYSALGAVVGGLLAGKLFFFITSFTKCNAILKDSFKRFLFEHARMVVVGASWLLICTLVPTPNISRWVPMCGAVALVGVVTVGVMFFFGLPGSLKSFLKKTLLSRFANRNNIHL